MNGLPTVFHSHLHCCTVSLLGARKTNPTAIGSVIPSCLGFYATVTAPNSGAVSVHFRFGIEHTYSFFTKLRLVTRAPL
jgi:hypothetical protein